MNNKDIILFILTLIILYLLFCNINRNNETFAQSTPSTPSTPSTKKPEIKNLPIGDLKLLIKKMVDKELKNNNLKKFPSENISIGESIKEFSKFVQNANSGNTTKLDILTVDNLIITSRDEKEKYKISVKDKNLNISNADDSKNGIFKILGSLNTIRDSKIYGDMNGINTKDNINITQGNLNINGNISTHNDIIICSNKGIKWFNGIDYTNNRIYGDNYGAMHINWGDNDSKVFFNSIYVVNNIETEGILNFKKHKWGNKELNDAKHYYYKKAKEINDYYKYMIHNPYSNIGNCTLCREKHEDQKFIDQGFGLAGERLKKYQAHEKEQDKKWAIIDNNMNTYSLIKVD